MRVSDLSDSRYHLCQNEGEFQDLCASVGIETRFNYGIALIHEGEIKSLWGYVGFVPYLDKRVYKVFPLEDTGCIPVFSYGILQLPRVQLNMYGRLVPMFQDQVIGYSTQSRYLGSGILQAYKCKGGKIEGNVIKLTRNELRETDFLEMGYVRIKIKTVSGISAFMYAKGEN